jgi:hypothetical protein
MPKKPPILTDEIRPCHRENIEQIIYSLSVNRTILTLSQMRDRLTVLVNTAIEATKD